MNWAAVGAIGEVAGAIAVVATLVYLAKQIRISAEATKAMVRQGVTDATVAYLALEIDPRDLREVTKKRRRGETLDRDEEDLLLLRIHANFRNFEGVFSNFRRGYFDASEWQAYENIILFHFLRDPFARKFWDRARERRPHEQRNWSREFAERVDELRDRAQAQLDNTGPRPGSVDSAPPHSKAAS
jgi:hypothetical protein